MRKKFAFVKKLYISIASLFLVLFTCAATTFAWIGVITNSNFESFDLEINSSGLKEYGIEISLDGIKFYDTLDFSALKKQILVNCGYDEDLLYSQEKVNLYFKSLKLEQCTPEFEYTESKILYFNEFRDLYGEVTNKFFKFDIYISANKEFYKDHDTSSYLLDAYIMDNLLSGNVKERILFNSYSYPDSFINPFVEMVSKNEISLPSGVIPLSAGDKITKAKIDSSSSCRVAFSKYKVVDKGEPGQYSSLDKPLSTLIYADSYDYPIYNTSTGVYSFGGILKDEDNFATAYFNSSEHRYTYGEIKSMSVPDKILNIRGVTAPDSTRDRVLSWKTNHLIDSNNVDEQISINQMMKMTIYFWFEGWDADCASAISGSPVNINITFSNSNENEF